MGWRWILEAPQCWQGSLTAIPESVLPEDSAYNRQIVFGTDILTRIFYSKDQPEKLEELRRAAVGSIREVLEKLEKKTGIAPGGSIQLVLAGNTTMVHFFLGVDAFCVFQTPYAVQADRPGFLPAAELELPVSGYVYCYPGKSNYLGGDIISGMVATELYKKEGISVFFDIGTQRRAGSRKPGVSSLRRGSGRAPPWRAALCVRACGLPKALWNG